MNRFERHPRLTMLGSFLVLFALGLAALEGLLRVTGLGPALVDDPRPLVQMRHISLREYSPDTVFRFTPPPIRQSAGDLVAEKYLIETDGDGFIKPGRIHDRPDVTIAFLGGSTTECLFVAPDARFPFLVGRMLEERLGIKVNTINAARSGNNTQHLNLVLQTKLIPLKPDIVVLMENTNDLGVLSHYGTYWNDSAEFALLAEEKRGLAQGVRLIRDSLIGYSYRIVGDSLKSLPATIKVVLGLRTAQASEAAQPVDARVEQWAASYEASLTQYVQTAAAWGIRPVLMTQVIVSAAERARGNEGRGNYLADDLLLRRGFSAESFDSTHAYFNAIMRSVARRSSAGFIDLAGAGGWDGMALYDGLHFTDSGSRRVAGIMTTILEAEIRNLRTAHSDSRHLR